MSPVPSATAMSCYLLGPPVIPKWSYKLDKQCLHISFRSDCLRLLTVHLVESDRKASSRFMSSCHPSSAVGCKMSIRHARAVSRALRQLHRCRLQIHESAHLRMSNPHLRSDPVLLWCLDFLAADFRISGLELRSLPKALSEVFRARLEMARLDTGDEV